MASASAYSSSSRPMARRQVPGQRSPSRSYSSRISRSCTRMWAEPRSHTCTMPRRRASAPVATPIRHWATTRSQSGRLRATCASSVRCTQLDHRSSMCALNQGQRISAM